MLFHYLKFRLHKPLVISDQFLYSQHSRNYLKKLIEPKMMKFINIHKLLTSSQYVFRVNSSTKLARAL